MAYPHFKKYLEKPVAETQNNSNRDHKNFKYKKFIDGFKSVPDTFSPREMNLTEVICITYLNKLYICVSKIKIKILAGLLCGGIKAILNCST